MQLILFLTGTLFISFLIAAILDVPGKLLALVACVRILLNLFSSQKSIPLNLSGKNTLSFSSNRSHYTFPWQKNYFIFHSSRHGWVGDSRTSASIALPVSSSSSTASFQGALIIQLAQTKFDKNFVQYDLLSRGENIDKMPVVVISMISR